MSTLTDNYVDNLGSLTPKKSTKTFDSTKRMIVSGIESIEKMMGATYQKIYISEDDMMDLPSMLIESSRPGFKIIGIHYQFQDREIPDKYAKIMFTGEEYQLPSWKSGDPMTWIVLEIFATKDDGDKITQRFAIIGLASVLENLPTDGKRETYKFTEEDFKMTNSMNLGALISRETEYTCRSESFTSIVYLLSLF